MRECRLFELIPNTRRHSQNDESSFRNSPLFFLLENANGLSTGALCGRNKPAHRHEADESSRTPIGVLFLPSTDAPAKNMSPDLLELQPPKKGTDTLY